jgi:putative restriction endonuclease
MARAPLVGYIANTDSDWFDFLGRKGRWDEVNFWNPSDYYAFRGALGSPFFFRLKAPRNMIGGFGLVSGFARLPEWLAWECYGEANGAASFEDMKRRLDEIRKRTQIVGGELKQIGCIILASAVFFPRDLWVRQPTDWARQNLRYATYDLSVGEGLRVWRECEELAPGITTDVLGDMPAEELAATRYGPPTLVIPRRGQGTFRVAVTEAYQRACAVTQEHSLPALEAAHIKPFGEDGPHAVSNGLLLRSDLHRLFDRGYITVTPDCKLEVHAKLKEHFNNGKSYYPLHGRPLVVPRSIGQRPDPKLLQWHNDVKFRSL